MNELRTERLRLRELDADDLDDLYDAVFSDPEVAWEQRALTRQEALRKLDGKLEHVRERGFGMMAVLDARDGAVLGYAGLQHLEGGKDVEIGYYLARRAWGNGFASELARELVRFGFEKLVLARIVAVVRPENDASKAVLRKAGLDFVEHGYHYGSTVEFWAIYATLPLPSADSQDAR